MLAGCPPDLILIDELRAVVQQDLDKQKPAANLGVLSLQLKRA